MRQDSGGKDIFKYRWIHQLCSNRLKVINITLIPLLGILETNSFSDRFWLWANPLLYMRGEISLHWSIILVERLGSNEASPPLASSVSRCLGPSRFFLILFLPLCSVADFHSHCCASLSSLSLPPSGLDCAVKAAIVCLRVISCLNEGRVNEIKFSRPYAGIALTDRRIVGLCVVCHIAPPHELLTRLRTRRLKLCEKLLRHCHPANKHGFLLRAFCFFKVFEM